MTETGILVTLPGGSRFWHRCQDAAAGYREMQAVHAETGLYGEKWDDPATVVEFGAVDPANQFTPRQRLRPAAAPTPKEG